VLVVVARQKMTACDAAGTVQEADHRLHPQDRCTHLRATIDTGKEGVAGRTTLGIAQMLNQVGDLPKNLEAHAKKGADRLACLKRTDAHPKPDEDVTIAIPAKVVLLNSVYAFSIN